MFKLRYRLVCWLKDEPIVPREGDRKLTLSVFGELVAPAGKMPQDLERSCIMKVTQPTCDPASNLITKMPAPRAVRTEPLLQFPRSEDNLQVHANQSCLPIW